MFGFDTPNPSYDPVADDEIGPAKLRSKTSSKWRLRFFILAGLEAVQVGVGAWWMASVSIQHVSTNPFIDSYYRLHQQQTLVTFDELDFEGRNSNDTLWRSLFPGKLQARVNEFNTTHIADRLIQDAQGIVSIPISSPLRPQQESRLSPLNDNHMLYQVSVFHHLHCLEMVKNTLSGLGGMEMNGEGGPEPDIRHSYHCIDWIRQALMCNIDLTLDATEDFHSFGQNGVHVCQNFDMVWDWAQEHGYEGSLEALTRPPSVSNPHVVA